MMMISRHIIMAISMALLMVACGGSPAIRGTVLDAVSGKPIEGAVVVAEWVDREGFGFYVSSTYKVEEKLTDANGEFGLDGVNKANLDLSFSIYKRGYVCWNNKSIFMDGHRTDFLWKTGQTYSLVPWQEGWSHWKHVGFIHSVADSRGKAFNKEFEWEEEEGTKEWRNSKEYKKW